MRRISEDLSECESRQAGRVDSVGPSLAGPSRREGPQESARADDALGSDFLERRQVHYCRE
eukprot:6464777-Pyramimonas_sp.AAC.1